MTYSYFTNTTRHKMPADPFRASSLRAHVRSRNVHCHHHRRKADSIFAKALICPFCTFLTPSPSSFPFKPPRSVVLVDASLRDSGDLITVELGGRSVIVSSFTSLGFLVRCFRTGGEPKMSPTGLGCCPRGNWSSSHGTPFMTLMFFGRVA